MKLSEVCIKHPVIAMVFSIAVVLLGAWSFQSLEIKYFPEHNRLTGNVSTTIEGASAEFMSKNVADKLTDAAAIVGRVKTMSTKCVQGSCDLNLIFEDNVTDIEYINLMNKLRSRVEMIDDFPPSMEEKPKVTDNSSDASFASNIISFVSTGDTTQQELFDYIKQQLMPQFRRLDGVGAIWGPYGGSAGAVRVWLLPDRMKALQVNPSDVVDAIEKYSTNFTAGKIIGEERSYSINVKNTVSEVNDVANLVIRSEEGSTVRLKDVAEVVMGTNSVDPSILTVNGDPAMAIQIKPLRSANPVSVAKLVRQKVEQLQSALPEGVQMTVVYDQADFIQSSIQEGFNALFEAIVLVSLIMVLFLGSLRLASIPIITIPICVIGVFSVMALLGFSINVLTMLSIILAIGLVVDDAIVVAENCYRRVEQGESPLHAALKGSKEIAFPVIAMTMTLAVVYTPIGFMSGLTVDLFRQFAFTLAAAVLISGFVALTLSPMMCAYVIKPKAPTSTWFSWFESKQQRLVELYLAELNKWFERKWWVAGGVVAILALSGLVFWSSPSLLLPTEDTGFIEAKVQQPKGANRQYNLDNVVGLNRIIDNRENIAQNLSFIEQEPYNHILLKPWGERTETAEEIATQLTQQSQAELSAYKASYLVRAADDLNTTDNVKLEIVASDRNLEQLYKTANEVTQLLKSYPGFTNVFNSVARDELGYELWIDRNAILLSGVDYQDVTETISTYLTSVKPGDLQAKDGFTYPIKVQVKRESLSDFKVLDRLSVVAEIGETVQTLPLSQFVTIEPSTIDTSLQTFMGLDAAEVSANLAPGYTASDVKSYIDQHVPKLLAKNQDFYYNGVVKELIESQQGTQTLFVMAIVFIYLILAAQFESFRDPFLILLTVPLCIVGALIALWVFGQSINIYSKIGLLTLVGLVTKHGILLVEFANQRHKEGIPLTEAMLSSARSRFRPIMMTTITMMLGALPLALASGPGSVGRVNIGLVLTGGLLSGTFFSLFVIPVAYVAMKSKRTQPTYAEQLNHE
ncbi:efflux RND transporter permease subunit [Vibrio mimicus]|uniref:efflux RND transporter permease subunit n=1 Tax=Vibrio mimicus TaxID=674 RepID=UPI002FEECF88